MTKSKAKKNSKKSVLNNKEFHCFNLSKIDPNKKYKDKDSYEEELRLLQKKMQALQNTFFHKKMRAIIVFEGWDASGKGGAIRRLTETLDPRGYQVHPIAAPSAEEQGKHYLYRFWQRLPSRGAMAIFDRSWYGRVLVERIEGLASKVEWRRSYHEIREFESLLANDGVRIIKIFLHISQDEQLARFAERLQNPRKRWKLTFEDIRNREKWKEYLKSYEDAFKETHTEKSPWFVVPANYKWYTRITVLKLIVDQLSLGLDISPPAADPGLLKVALKQLGISATTIEKIKKEKQSKEG